jgi:hypothetical protein
MMPIFCAEPGLHPFSHVPLLAALCASAVALAAGCGGSTSASSTSSSSTSANVYATAYKTVSWGSTVTVSFPSACEMTLSTTGKPNYTPNAYYLAPASGSETVVAYTAQTKMPLTVISYAEIEPMLQGTTATLNICPSKASATTAAGLGAIGYLISGTAMFNPFEADASTAAVADNASYTFTDSSGSSRTAYFLDQCDSHSNGTTWHAHGDPACVASQVDTATGPSHILGIALDGFPIYGGRDINGAVIPVSQLDACNGIASATPEFPSGAYHYVLPIGVTTNQASLNCYSGTVPAAAKIAAARLACNMKAMFAMAHAVPLGGRSVPNMAMANAMVPQEPREGTL